MGMKIVAGLKPWFFHITSTVPVSDEVKVYVIDVLSKPKLCDMSRESVVLAQSRAKSFVDYQHIGDWALWIGSYNNPGMNIRIIETMGRLSYGSCYRLLGRRLRVYEELADELPTITRHVYASLNELR